ncbi:MAG: 4-(cytidine 5'-diphospho)-2-C-methyl-D-erythritol kinase [Lachnospiraceae bacterium]|nr:4-(cytidine 5'-diphospho)-2-C-methyl-D-erythritol kinase [Lachnospiraceae bacterium]
MKIYAPAKLNLTLDVTGLRDDGYHLVKMVMQSVSLCDELTIEKVDDPAQTGIILTCDREGLETDERNLVWKAANLITETCSVKSGVRIDLKKNIPMAAGLAGGSSDAAAMLRGMNELFDLGLSESKLMELGVKIGADVPYCVMGKTALAEGIGEILSPLAPMPDCGILLAKPAMDVATGGVYKALDALSGYEHPDTDGMIDALKAKDISSVSRLLCNVLENVTAANNPVIGSLKEQMLTLGALGSLMSGSGPTVFGIFENLEKAEAAYDLMKGSGFDGDIFAVKPLG